MDPMVPVEPFPTQYPVTPPSPSPAPTATSTPPPAGNAMGSLLTGTVTHFIQSEVTLVKERTAWTLGNLARFVRQAGSELRKQNQGAAADYTDKAADQMERASDYLHHSDINHMAGDLEQLARQQPAAIIAGSLVVGFVAARFLKSSGQHQA